MASPALNQNKSPNLPPTEVPVYIQIGQLEDAKPAQSQINSNDMRDVSRLDACKDFHDTLQREGYNVSELNIHPYGHSESHVIQAIQKGVKYIETHQSVLDEKLQSSDIHDMTPVADTQQVVKQFKQKHQELMQNLKKETGVSDEKEEKMAWFK